MGDGFRLLAQGVTKRYPLQAAAVLVDVVPVHGRQVLLALFVVGLELVRRYENPVPVATWWLHDHPETTKPDRKTGPSA